MACESYVTQARTFLLLLLLFPPPRIVPPPPPLLLLLLLLLLPMLFSFAFSRSLLVRRGYGGHRTLLSATGGTNWLLLFFLEPFIASVVPGRNENKNGKMILVYGYGRFGIEFVPNFECWFLRNGF